MTWKACRSENRLRTVPFDDDVCVVVLDYDGEAHARQDSEGTTIETVTLTQDDSEQVRDHSLGSGLFFLAPSHSQSGVTD